MKILSPIKAIRKNRIECMGGSRREVPNCEILDCPLFPYRMGHDPKRKGKGGRSSAEMAEIRRKLG